ncbi:16S rRNA (guanine(527)-N(7))-methyltransferase RsmG [Candidatus Spongiihabitans sp.]|uniref:16S rRNA (guanine(527)-N(7))-methyltransferase RsmG n=1 Tax=Candidatus Spongiihabitans sp. TaxID=3101308 RepID=UPI003C7E6C23
MTKPRFNAQNLINGCEQLGIGIDAHQQMSLLTHIELLAKWNARLNLTAIASNDDMISHHILDSLAIHRHVIGGAVLDIGSGGGFPGLPLAIVNPQWRVTLLDSRGKRVEFLRNCISNLALKNVSLVKSRIENYQPHRKFDTLTARAFAPLPGLVRLSQANLSQGTRLLALKGRFPAKEIESLTGELPALPKLPEQMRPRLTVEKLEVPFLEAQRHLIIIDF